jgi:hypothetical protein
MAIQALDTTCKTRRDATPRRGAPTCPSQRPFLSPHTKEYGSSWIFEPRLTCANVLRPSPASGFLLGNFASDGRDRPGEMLVGMAVRADYSHGGVVMRAICSSPSESVYVMTAVRCTNFTRPGTSPRQSALPHRRRSRTTCERADRTGEESWHQPSATGSLRSGGPTTSSLRRRRLGRRPWHLHG